MGVLGQKCPGKCGFRRPSTQEYVLDFVCSAIHEAANDGNPATASELNWTPLLERSTSPEHPSGHACASGAITRTLQHFFDTDEIAFSAFSPTSGNTRSFSRLSQAPKEIEGARTWGGIHFRIANTQGQRLGRADRRLPAAGALDWQRPCGADLTLGAREPRS